MIQQENAVADEDYVPADRTSEDEAVERGHGIQLIGRHLKDGGNVLDCFIGHPAPVMLDDIQRFDGSGRFCRAMVKLGVDLLYFLFA
jgi:hypothetical protein